MRLIKLPEGAFKSKLGTGSILIVTVRDKLFRVLFVQPSGAAYGSEKSLLAIIGQDKFIRAELVCAPDGPLAGMLRSRGLVVHELEFNKFPFPRHPGWHFSFFRHLKRILRRSAPHALVINLDSNIPLVTLASLCSRTPIIRYSRFEFRPPRRWIDRFCWLRCSAVICPSAHVRNQVMDWAPTWFRPRVHHFYDPHVQVAVTDGQKAHLKLELSLANKRVVTYVGRLHFQKRVETVIRAVSEVRKRVPNTQLLIVGNHDGSNTGVSYERLLRDLTAELEQGNAVQFVGYRRDINAILAASDVLVLPSESESLGMVLLEAWGLKVPTVSSDVAGCREISLASGGGLLCPVGDHVKMAGLIRDLLANPERTRQLGESGRNWVMANCNPEAYAERFARLLASFNCASSVINAH